MDLLASLGLRLNALPEQSTRLTSHPGIVRALESGTDVRLGFNCCLHCGSKLPALDGGDERDTSKKSSKAASTCKGCKRVKYCSTSCRKADSEEESTKSSVEEEPSACGHSPVICALLNLINDDDAAEEEYYAELNATNNGKKKSATNDKTADQKMEAARYRINTEFESYHATLFNILSEGPDWFIEALTRRLRRLEDVRSPEPETKKRRRDKRDRSSTSPAKQHQSERKRELVLHVVGASVDSEFWGWGGPKNESDDSDDEEREDVPVLNAYAEASTNLTSYLKDLLEISSISIRCIFVGPECPSRLRVEIPIPDSRSSTITFETHCCNYGDANQPYLPPPDAIVFFNPGFSCEDYDWSAALTAASAYQVSSASLGATPFLITTNTEMEGLADMKYLLDGGYVDAKSLPGDILEAIDYNTNGDEDGVDGSATFFFSENTYAGMRVRQSGTMGNDLYVKSRWIVGGLFQSSGKSQQKKRKNAEMPSTDGSSARKRHRVVEGYRDGGGKNTKKKNPALI